MKPLGLSAVFLFALSSAGAQAQSPAPSAPKVFRCTDSKGGIIYTDKPETNCKTVRIAPPPAASTATKEAAKAPPVPKARIVARAPELPTHKSQCVAISKAAAELAAGKTGGLDAAGAAHRRARLEKQLSGNCRPGAEESDD